VVETPVPFEDEYTSGEELIIWDNLFAPRYPGDNGEEWLDDTTQSSDSD